MPYISRGVDKSKPVPFIYWTIRFNNGELKEGNCPCCPAIINNFNSKDCCHNCGQRIDWENSVDRSTIPNGKFHEFLNDWMKQYPI